MTTFILLLFVSYSNEARAAVQVDFNSQETCIAAGKTMVEGFGRDPALAGARVVWSCVQK